MLRLTAIMATHTEMDVAQMATESETSSAPVVKKQKKVKPARKQVKPGDVEKKETPQTGKEYSAPQLRSCPASI
jgi:hypothetical protein